MRPTTLLLCSALLLSACASVSGLRDDYRQTLRYPHPTPAGNHLQLSIPITTLNSLLNQQKPTIGAGLAIPGQGSVRFSLQRLTIHPLPDGVCRRKLRVSVKLDLSAATGRFPGLKVEALVPFRGSRVGPERLELVLMLSRMERLKVRWPASWIRSLRSQISRSGIPGPLLDQLLRGLTNGLVQQLTPALKRLPWESIARVRFRLPSISRFGPLPISTVRFGACGSTVWASATSTLFRSPAPLRPSGLLRYGSGIYLDGRFIAHAVRVAMLRGVIARRFSLRGKPDSGGPLRVNIDWADRPESIKISLWHLKHPAGVAEVLGKLQATLESGRLTVRIRALKLLRVRGNLLFQMGLWNRSRTWLSAVKVVQKLMLPKRLKVGRASLTPRLKRIIALPSGFFIVTNWGH